MDKFLKLLFLLFFISIPGYSQQYNVLKYGALPDGKTVCTEAINKAVDACYNEGGGEVFLPSGRYISGTIILKSNVCLHLDRGCTLLASTNHSDFPVLLGSTNVRSDKDRGGWYALIYANQAENIGIKGPGVIDGQGSKQKPRPKSLGGDLDGRPRNVLFISCKGVTVESVHLNNSGIWNQHYLDCEDVIVDRVQVYNHGNRNNDGIDIDCCSRFVLSNSIFDSDDDGITLKSTGRKVSEDIVITNCIVSSQCNPIKAGTESLGGFKNVAITNCVIKPSRCKNKAIFNDYRKGIAGLSLEMVDGGIVEGITISNIVIDGTMCPLYIRLGNRGRTISKEDVKPSIGSMKNISISNVVAYNCGNFCSSITAVPGAYIENVTLNNIQIYNEGGVEPEEYVATIKEVKEDEKGYPQPTVWGNLPSSGLFLRHVKNIQISNIILGSQKEEIRVPIMGQDIEGLSIRQTRVQQTMKSKIFFKGEKVTVYDIEKPLGWKYKILDIN